MIVALSVSIFSLYNIKQKQTKKVRRFHNIFSWIFKILHKNKNFWEQLFEILIFYKPFLVSCEVSQGPIGSAFLTFIGYKQSDRQTSKKLQIDSGKIIKFSISKYSKMWILHLLSCILGEVLLLLLCIQFPIKWNSGSSLRALVGSN